MLSMSHVSVSYLHTLNCFGLLFASLANLIESNQATSQRMSLHVWKYTGGVPLTLVRDCCGGEL
jgi:hypothetical protein